jgi:outer membrane lipoprotein-sorting protein
MQKLILSAMVAGSALCLAVPLPARATDAKTAEEIQECVKKNAPALSSSQTVVMRAFDRAGEPTESRYRLLWKRPEGESGRLLLRVLDPPARRGSALLLVQKGERDADIYLYLADLRKTRRVTKKSLQGSMFGTDLSYEDFQRVQQMADESSVERGEDGEVGGRKVYTLVAKPREGSAYERAVSLVDQERCLIVRAEYYGSGEKPSKVLSVNQEKITKEDFGWLPREIRVDDLEEGTHTDLIIEEFDATTEVSDSDLSVANLESAGR